METDFQNPVDTAISHRLKRERKQIIDKFKKDYLYESDSDDPLEKEKKKREKQKRRFTGGNVTRQVVTQQYDDGSKYEGEVSLDGSKNGKGRWSSIRHNVFR